MLHVFAVLSGLSATLPLPDYYPSTGHDRLGVAIFLDRHTSHWDQQDGSYISGAAKVSLCRRAAHQLLPRNSI